MKLKIFALQKRINQLKPNSGRNYLLPPKSGRVLEVMNNNMNKIDSLNN